MRLVYAPRVLRDIDKILEYVQKSSANGAGSISIAIEHTAGVCAESPRGGALTDEPHVYRWPLRSFRYTIFYRFDPAHDVVEIIRVIHAARVSDLQRLPDND